MQTLATCATINILHGHNQTSTDVQAPNFYGTLAHALLKIENYNITLVTTLIRPCTRRLLPLLRQYNCAIRVYHASFFNLSGSIFWRGYFSLALPLYTSFILCYTLFNLCTLLAIAKCILLEFAITYYAGILFFAFAFLLFR